MVGEEFSVGVEVADDLIHLQQFIYTIDNLPPGAHFDTTTGYLDWTPAADQVGDHVVTFNVSDGELSTSASVTITVRENHPPVIDDIAEQVTEENQELIVRIPAHDPDETDSPSYVYESSSLPQGAYVNMSYGYLALFWKPTTEQIGRYENVKVVVADRGKLTASKTFTIVVKHANRAPVFDVVDAQTVTAGTALTVTVLGHDPDGDTLTYSIVSMPSGATFQGRVLAWTPSAQQVGACQVVFQVSDGKASSTLTVAITVNAPAAPAVAPAPPPMAAPVAPVKTVSLITRITPAEAEQGRQILYMQIYGKGFGSYNNSKSKVTISNGKEAFDVYASIWQDAHIQIGIYSNTQMTPGNYAVCVTNAKGVSNEVPFKVLAPRPVIKAVAPSLLRKNASIVITGTYFGAPVEKSELSIMVNNTPMKIKATIWKNDKITFICPQLPKAGNYSLILTNQYGGSVMMKVSYVM